MKKNCVIYTVSLIIMFAILSGKAQEKAQRGIKLEKPRPDMSATDLMKINYIIKYSKFLDDITFNKVEIHYISRSGGRRYREAKRFRIILNRASDGLDYKDMVILTSPENVKGLAVMTWSYIDPKKQRDQWLWLPSLKKVRRTSPADADDAFMGTDLTVEDVTSRRLEDETYKKLPDEVFPGYTMKLDGKIVNKDVPCYVIECTPKKKDWYYTKRKVYLSKEYSANIYEEFYDSNGKKTRISCRIFKLFPEGPILVCWEMEDLKTDHASDIVLHDLIFNQGVKERMFSEKSLMRMKW